MTVTDETTPTDAEVRNDSSPQEPPQGQARAGDPGTPPEAAQDDDSGQDKPPTNREARYRTERNEARAQVAELTERVARMQEVEAVRLAAPLLENPGDLVLFGTVGDVLDDDGMVDPERVRTAARDLIASRPGLAKGARVPAPSFGQGNRTPIDWGDTGTNWGQVLRGR